jgi:hypothetical protein
VNSEINKHQIGLAGDGGMAVSQPSSPSHLKLGLVFGLVFADHSHCGTMASQNSFHPVVGMDTCDAISFMHRLHLLAWATISQGDD